MIFHIAKRELYDNMTSLRFALTLLLLLVLMAVNAINHLGDYRARITVYREDMNEALGHMKDRTDTLYHLIRFGPGKLHKKPSPLSFCAVGGEAMLSRQVESWQGGSWAVRARNEENGKVDRDIVFGLWRLGYPQPRANLGNILPKLTQLDWVFLISVVFSFVAILFTFDTISGEQERGTLRLTLANSVPRDAVLLGKFLGILTSIGVPFLVASLLNLFLLSAVGGVDMGKSEWGRISVIILIGLIYVSIFIAIGLLVSARARQASASLMILLLIWVVLVVLTPSTLGSITSGLKPAMTRDEYRSREVEIFSRLFYEEYECNSDLMRNDPLTREIPPKKVTSKWSEFVVELAQAREKLNHEHLNDQIFQVQFARNITRVSPAAVVRYAIESLAATGLSRHLDFLEQTRHYATEYRQFLQETDAADSQSPHAIGVAWGVSQRPVNFEAIPKFEDLVTFSDSFNSATVDILLLVLFLVVFFAGAYLSFLRVDI